MDARGRRVVFMFGGQRSQYYHMGRGLFDADPTYRAWLLRGDDCAVAGPAPPLDHRHIWQVIRQPVRFADTIAQIDHPDRCVYVDLSPPGTLATFAGNILPSSLEAVVVPILSPFGNDGKRFGAAVDRIRAAAAAGPARADRPEIP